MLFLATGSLGFICTLFFDWADARGWRYKGILTTLSTVLIVPSCVVLALSRNRFPVPPALQAAGWLLSALFFLLLVYSLFVEIPISKSYGNAERGRHVVRTGTYALVRHPGVLWFFFLTLSLVVVSGSRPLFAAVPVWTLLNIALVTVEDWIFFPMTFGSEYKRYRRSVPFLIPTPSSVHACLSTIFRGGGNP